MADKRSEELYRPVRSWGGEPSGKVHAVLVEAVGELRAMLDRYGW